MLRVLLALCLSALTLVGGHFLNRRWDRALLFFVMLVLWGAGLYASMTLRLSGVAETTEVEQFEEILTSHWNAFGVGSVVIWIVSLGVTYSDARRPKESTKNLWTVSGAVAAVGLSLVTGVFVALGAMTIFAAFGNSPDDPAADARVMSKRKEHERPFMHYVYFGGDARAEHDLPRPPIGEGYLRGRFMVEGKPARGVRVQLTLNGQYQTAKLRTDENGEFTVRVPSGEWFVNRLATDHWTDRPEQDNFTIVSGAEARFAGGRYNEDHWRGSDGMKLTVRDVPGETQLQLTLRKRVAVKWPEADEKDTQTTVDEGVISWEPYPDAATYVVRVTELASKGRVTSYREVISAPITGQTTFPLASLPTVPGDEDKTYQVTIFAFAKDDSFLSRSDERRRGHTFLLTDKKQFAREEDFAGGFGKLTEAEMTQIFVNNGRLDAVQVLLKEGLLKEAETLLGNVVGKTDPGRKSAITGFLMAKRGRCKEANRLFTQAQVESGRNCVPSYYRAPCAKSTSAK